MLTLLKYLAIIALVIIILRVVIRPLSRLLLRYLLRKLGGQMHFQHFQPPRSEGEVRLEGEGAKGKKVKRDVGEYVDYKEVKDKE